MSSHPILSCEESLAFEQKLLGGDPEKEWDAMNQVGQKLAHQVLLDFNEFRPFPRDPQILVLAGKGHNGGDALLAAHQLLKARPRGQATVLPADDPKNFKPNTKRAFDSLDAEKNCKILGIGDIPEQQFDISIDGLLGMQFRPPFRAPLDILVPTLNQSVKIGYRAAVDLPSGLGDESATEPLRADFTYATGVAKAPLFHKDALRWTGRIRYIDIGFFEDSKPDTENPVEILTESVLDPLRKLRHPACDKRTHGHLFLLGGSRNMPGALLMSVRAALRSGVGLVTAFAPESVAAQFAAAAPEAMWVAWPETPDGGLSLEGQHLLRERISRASALAMGPGMGAEHETQVMMQEILKETQLPVVLDADALQPDIVTELQGPAVLTPHLGEMARISGTPAEAITPESVHADMKSNDFHHTVLLKGPLTWITDRKRLYVSPFGSPVLAKGGSGDLLTGLLGGLLAQGRKPFDAASMAAAWHGQTSEYLARNRGQTAATVTLLLNYLHEPLRP